MHDDTGHIHDFIHFKWVVSVEVLGVIEIQVVVTAVCSACGTTSTARSSGSISSSRYSVRDSYTSSICDGSSSRCSKSGVAVVGCGCDGGNNSSSGRE